MGFYDRFELLELVRDDGVKTFRAREVATGRTVEAHLFVNPYAPLSVALLARIDQLGAPENSRIVDSGRHEGTPYVVTEPLSGHAGFREWVMSSRPSKQQGIPEVPPQAPAVLGNVPGNQMSQAGAWEIRAPGPSSTVPAPPAGAPATGVDEQFANLFHSAPRAAPSAPAPTVQPPARPAPNATLSIPVFPELVQGDTVQPKPPGSTQPAATPPGEFTQLFRAQGSVPQSATPQAHASPQPAANQPGEFTQLFTAQGVTPHPVAPQAPAPAPPAAQNQPGEFTQLFNAQGVTRQPAAPPAPVAPASAPQNRPGEFTQLFTAQGVTQQPAAPPAPAPQASAPENRPGEFTQLFTAQGVTQQPVAPPAPAPQAPAAPPPAPAGAPGAFTQLFTVQNPAVSSAPVSSEVPPAPAPPPGEFTRMVQAQPPQQIAQKETWRPNQLAPANPPSGSQPGEFTRFFQAPIGPMPQSPALQQPLKAVTPAGSNNAGEFTQRFGNADIPQPPAPTPVALPPAANNATQGFSVPVAGYPAPQAGYPPAPQTPYGVPNYYDPYNPYGVRSPSEFTQKFTAPAQLTLGQPSADPAAAAAPQPSRIRQHLPLILGGVVLLLVVVIVILVFARK